MASIILRQSIAGSVSRHNTAHRGAIEPSSAYSICALSVHRSIKNSQSPATMANSAQNKGARAALVRTSRIFDRYVPAKTRSNDAVFDYPRYGVATGAKITQFCTLIRCLLHLGLHPQRYINGKSHSPNERASDIVLFRPLIILDMILKPERTSNDCAPLYGTDSKTLHRSLNLTKIFFQHAALFEGSSSRCYTQNSAWNSTRIPTIMPGRSEWLCTLVRY